MRIVILKLEILELIFGDRRGPPADAEPRQRTGLARQLQVDLLQVIEVEMAIAAGPYEIADAEIALLRHHVH